MAVGYSYVYHDWLAMGLVPDNASLFVPELSAIPMHLNAILQGKYIDLWLPWVRDTFGPGVLFLTLLLPLTLFGCAAAVLLRQPELLTRCTASTERYASANGQSG